MNVRNRLVSMLSIVALVASIGVTSLVSAPAGASGATHRSQRTVHRVATVHPFAARPAHRAFGPGTNLRRLREVTARHNELRSEAEGEATTPHVAPVNPTPVTRPGAHSALKVSSSFTGLNSFDSAVTNGFDLEPPDQGLCVGRGKVLEVVNDVIDVYSKTGDSLLGATDLNTFYGYIPGYDPNTGINGPAVTDPDCVYDPQTQRWFVTVLTLEVDQSNYVLTGPNHLDIAVSATRNPLGAWNVYQIPVQDDGTDGTPDHHCVPTPSEVPPEATNPNACLGDYPQLAIDANGVYITTNEYTLFEPTGLDLHAAQIYAMPKATLAAGDPDVALVQFDTEGAIRATQAGFTLKPANAPSGDWSTDGGGTIFFLSNNAAPEVSDTGSSSDLIVWSLSRTETLGTSQAVQLRHRILQVRTYAIPPRQNQKVGDFPQGQCVNDTEMDTPFGKGCWQYYFEPKDEPPHDMVEGSPDALDSRIMTNWYQDGTLFGALDTAVRFASPGSTDEKAGIEWFVVHASVSHGKLHTALRNQGVVAVADNNVSFPDIAVTGSGQGVMGMSLMGDDYYPSAAWTKFDRSGPGTVHVVARGAGPYDGFGAYPPISGVDHEITRWGDYGAATVAGSNLWIANEWVGQTCTLQEYVDSGFTCGDTRSPFENWYTRVTQVSPRT